MKTLVPSALILALLAGALVGGEEEPTLLGRLEREIQTVTDRADRAVVALSIPVTSWRALPDPRKKGGQVALEFDALQGLSRLRPGRYVIDSAIRTVTAEWSSVGVLVGSPPVIVTAGTVGTHREVGFRLADGREGKATLVLHEADLGLTVYALPKDLAEGLEGLEVDPTFDVARGRLALAAGPGREPGARPLDLVTTRGSDLFGGWFFVDGVGSQGLPGAPLVGSDGRLLGIATASSHLPPSTTAQSCRACHRVGTDGGDRLATTAWQYFYDAKNLQTSRARDAAAKALGWTTTNLDYVRDGKSGIFYLQSTQELVPPPGAFLSGGVIARVLEDLDAHGRVRHSYLGVVLGQTKGKGDELGVEVQSVLDGSPAKKAGIEAGARIRSVDGRPLHDPALLNRVLVFRRPGETVRLGLVGAEKETAVVLGDRDSAESTIVTPESLGLHCVELGGELRRFLKLGDDTQGVVVREVVPGSVAAQVGIQRGDVITAGGGEYIEDLGELQAAVAGAGNLARLQLSLIRAGRSLKVTLQKSGDGIRDRAR